MSLNISFDHVTSVHGSAHSSLSDEEDSSGTGVKVSLPSHAGSQDYSENFEDTGDWAHLSYPDELHPSDSASRPRTSNQDRPPEAARGGEARERPRRHTAREHERRRAPASPGSLAYSDDYDAYVRGGPDRRYYPTVPSGPPITYAPSSSSGYTHNPYLPTGIPGNQLVPIGGTNPPPYPHQYPPPTHHPGAGFLGGHPGTAPLVHQMPSHGGTPYGGTPYGGHEMYAPHNGGYFPYGQPYPMQQIQQMQMPQMPQGMIPSPYYHPYQRIQSPVLVPTPPPQPAAAPPPPAPEPTKPDEGIARLEQLLMDQKLQQEKREAALEKAAQEKAALEERAIQDKELATKAATQAAADAKAAAEAKAAEDVAKAKDEAATKAAADAKAEAEAKAADDMAKAEAKAADDMAKAEAKAAEDMAKAKEEAEAAMKKAVAEASAVKPPEEKKKPIKFKDAVGRKFSFPFHLCCTWAGMEELIRQAFLHVEVIGPHVAEGHYDLVGPNGEIILPQVWETMVEPDWTITMHMWPMPEPPPPDPDPPPPDDLPQVMIVEPKKSGDPGAPPPPPPAPAPPHSGPSVFVINPDHPGKKKPRPQEVPRGVSWFAGRSKNKQSLKAGKKLEEAVQHDVVCRVM